MTSEIQVLLLSAASIGFIHTLIGPDHYLPFIMMAKAGRWSFQKTISITILCGVGHVAGSVVLGFIGIAAGIAISKLELVEGVRGDIATWVLIAFGLVYMLWGLKRAWRSKPHTHKHLHEDGTIHAHEHTHQDTHTHVHESGNQPSVTPWILFAIFVLGPCEPLIPLLMYTAALQSATGVLAVSLVFAVTTIATMTAIVALAYAGIKPVRTLILEKYMHAMAGFTLLISGLAMQFLGL